MSAHVEIAATESSPSVGDPARQWEILDLGEVDYSEALALQLKCRDAVEAGHRGFWLLLQHPAVVTMGKRATAMEDLPHGPDSLRDLGIDFARTDRGGKLTFHHPGQIVGYPILSLRQEQWKLRSYVERLARLIAGAISPFGIEAVFRHDHPGLWVERHGLQRKLASIGVHVRRSVTTHGFALNVHRPSGPLPEMKWCGLGADRITSMEESLGYRPDLSAVKKSLIRGIYRMDRTHA